MEKRKSSLFARAEYQALQTRENYMALIEGGDVKQRKETLRLFRLLEAGRYDIVNHAVSSLESNFNAWANLKADIADWFSHTYYESEGRTFLGVTTYIPCLVNVPYELQGSEQDPIFNQFSNLGAFCDRATEAVADAYLAEGHTVMLGDCLISEEKLVTGLSCELRREIADAMTCEHVETTILGESPSATERVDQILDPISADSLEDGEKLGVFYMPCNVLMEVSRSEYDNKYIFPLTTRYCMPFSLHMGCEGLELLVELSDTLTKIASEELVNDDNPYSLEYRMLAPQTMCDAEGVRSILIKKLTVDNHLPDKVKLTDANVDIEYVPNAGGYSCTLTLDFNDESGVAKDCVLNWFYQPYSSYQHTHELSLLHSILEMLLSTDVKVNGKLAE